MFIRLSTYVVMSWLLAIGIVVQAWLQHEQYYTTVRFLCEDKFSSAILYNTGLSFVLLVGSTLLRFFVGTLRDLEMEQLMESGKTFIADTMLFLLFCSPTINSQEVEPVTLIHYMCVIIFLKLFHLVGENRVAHMFEVGVPRVGANVRLGLLLALLLLVDTCGMYTLSFVAGSPSTFYTWIFMELITMWVAVTVSTAKYAVQNIDMRLENGWVGKSVFMFYLDLIGDVLTMSVFIAFVLIFFLQRPEHWPVYMMADVMAASRQLVQRLRSFRRYRQITTDMDRSFPTACAEEIERAESCIICRDELWEGAKKLPCSHIFHTECLRSWLIIQQTCPTCRAEIVAPTPAPHVHAPPAQPAVPVPAPAAPVAGVAAPAVVQPAAAAGAPVAMPAPAAFVAPAALPGAAAPGAAAPGAAAPGAAAPAAGAAPRPGEDAVAHQAAAQQAAALAAGGLPAAPGAPGARPVGAIAQPPGQGGPALIFQQPFFPHPAVGMQAGPMGPAFVMPMPMGGVRQRVARGPTKSQTAAARSMEKQKELLDANMQQAMEMAQFYRDEVQAWQGALRQLGMGAEEDAPVASSQRPRSAAPAGPAPQPAPRAPPAPAATPAPAGTPSHAAAAAEMRMAAQPPTALPTSTSTSSL